MTALILVASWLLLLVLCWPLAFLALLLAPLIWLISLPLLLFGIAIDGVFSLFAALFLLPARLPGSRGSRLSQHADVGRVAVMRRQLPFGRSHVLTPFSTPHLVCRLLFVNILF